MEEYRLGPYLLVEALGIYFGHDKDDVRKLNWDTKLEKIENLLNSWKRDVCRYLENIICCRIYSRNANTCDKTYKLFIL